MGAECNLTAESNLYASVGERGQGNIAQNFTEHPGSIIKIKLDGSVPKDNPKFIKNKNGYRIIPNWCKKSSRYDL